MTSRNQTANGARTFRRRGMVLAALAIWLVTSALPTLAADRRFMVILANPTKTYPPNGVPAGGFANPAIVEAHYFDINPDNEYRSLAEYFDEISYGAVTVTGQTFGWINLPWPLEPADASPVDYINLDFNGLYTYGVGEEYLESPMPYLCLDGRCNGIAVDYNGTPGEDSAAYLGRPHDAYPPGFHPDIDEEEGCFCCPDAGGACGPFDVDADDDGFEETCTVANPEPGCVNAGEECLDAGSVCCGDLICRTSGEPPDQTAVCMRDIFTTPPAPPDVVQCDANTCCTPDGCLPLCSPGGCTAEGSVTAPQCIALGGRVIEDDGEGNPSESCYEECYPCGSETRPGQFGAQARGPNIPTMPIVDGVYTPGERFRDVNGDGFYSALFEPSLDLNGDGICDNERLDTDGSGQDLPEPFEDYMIRWDAFAMSSQGDWVFANVDYIRSNYPLRRSLPDVRDFDVGTDGMVEVPTECLDPIGADCWREHCQAPYCWNFETAVLDHFAWEFGWDCDLRDDDLSDDDPVCIYFMQEMFRLRGLGEFQDTDPDTGEFDPNKPFLLNDAAIAKWTNVDEMVWRTGNGVYDPPERFADVSNTKMQHVPDGTPWISATPEPGTYAPDIEGGEWYADFWRSRYGTEAPTWSHGYTSGRNIPRMVEFDPANPNPNFTGGGTAAAGQRKFDANAGQSDRPTSGQGFLAGDIEPDVGVGYYDGWVEHDDLASSKYHAFGDQRFGEVTSPYNDEIWGHDRGTHNPSSAGGPDDTIAAAGPWAVSIHGDNRLDGGNVMNLEWTTWRTDVPYFDYEPFVRCMYGLDTCSGPYESRIECCETAVADEIEFPAGCTGVMDCFAQGGWTPSIVWDWESLVLAGRDFHPYAGPFSDMGLDMANPLGADFNSDGIPEALDRSPDGYGFRDFNLDGLVDQGEVRPAGSHNYMADPISGTSNNGSVTEYPFNRRRLMEDCVEILDRSVDFDTFQDLNSLARVYGAGTYTEGIIEGLVSGIVLFPPDALSDHNLFPFSPSYYPIHVGDRDPNRKTARFAGAGLMAELPPLDPTGPDAYNSTLWFHDLPAGVDRGEVSGGGGIGGGGAGGDGGAHYQIRYAIHEYLHTWEKYLDLYDYARLEDQPEAHPIGEWCIMADGERQSGYPVHPVADKKSEYSGWVEPVDLRTVLTPGVEREVTFGDCETSNDETYYYFSNPLATAPDPDVGRAARARERFYFWRAGFAGLFDTFLPGSGLLVLHTNWLANDEGLPPQQHLQPFTWNIIQADGLYNLDAQAPSGSANTGDAGDPFPGSAGTTVWNHNTFPGAHSRWHSGAFSGIEITDVVETDSATRVTFRWMPTEVPSLSFKRPPGGASVGGQYNIEYEAYDQHAGTTIKFYYDTDNTGYNGTLIGEAQKQTPQINEPGSIPWDVSPLADGRYFVYAKLEPGVGVDGQSEARIGQVRAARGNNGNGTMTSPTVSAATAKLENWTITCLDLPGTTWSVVGSVSGQHANATTNTPYTSGGGEVQFTIQAGSTPFTMDDQFTFVTTGLTTYSAGVTVTGGEVSNAPIAKIVANPLAGDPPLKVEFDARSSDPNGAASLNYSWKFGDGSPTASGDQVSHTYDEPGTFSVTLTATNPATSAFGTAEVEVKVNNGKPHAEIEWAAVNPDSKFPFEVRFYGNGSSDPEDLPLEYVWDFGDETSSTEEDPPVHTYFPRDDDDTPYCVQVKLLVTDSAGDTDLAVTAVNEICPGNAPPKVQFSATPARGAAPLEVKFDASGTADSDAGQTLTFTWDFGDATGGTGKTITHTYTKVGIYTAKLTVDDGLTKISTTTKITVEKSSEDPTARFTATPTSGNPPLTVEFDASTSVDPQDGETLSSYAWNFDDDESSSNTASGVKVKHTFQNPGTYLVRLTVTDSDGNKDTTSVTVTVAGDEPGPGEFNRPPTAAFRNDPEGGFAPLTVDFESNSSDPDGDELTHAWDFGDGNSGTGDEIAHTFTAAGTYRVLLTVTDPGSLSHTAEKTIEVKERTNSAPVARIATPAGLVSSPGDGTPGVIEAFTGTDLTLNANTSSDADGDALSYAWTIEQSDEAMFFDPALVGALVVLRFRGSDAACDLAGNPCLTPGTYMIYVNVSDGFGGTAKSDPWELRVIEGEAPGGQTPVFDGTDGDDGVPLSGSRSGGGGSGLCGLGVQLPILGIILLMAVRLTSRRRRM